MKFKDQTREVPKHLKKKNPSKFKAINKSDHKHMYSECLLKYENSKFYRKSEYCTICGKLGNVEYITPVEDCSGRVILKVLTQEEVLEMYKGLTIYNVKDCTEKCIDTGN